MPEENQNQINEPVVSQNSAVPASTSSMPVGRQLLVLGGLLTFIFAFGVFLSLEEAEEFPGEQVANVNEVTNIITPAAPGTTFDEVYLEAKSAIVIDLKSGEVMYERAPDEVLPLASITKLMTALVASEIVDQNKSIKVSSAATLQSGDDGLRVGDTFSFANLTDLVLMSSSNDGAYALAASVGEALSEIDPATAFVKAMNVRAKELGLTSTYFRNPTGLDITETEAGAYGSARDVAKLMSYLVQNEPELLESTTKRSAYIYDSAGGLHDAENTNPVVESIPTTIGSKTGYTTLAGGNLTVAFNAGIDRPIVVVVLGSSHQGRFSDVLQLVEAARTDLRDNN